MLRQGDVKLIHHAGLPPELFDLAVDPDELRDLAALPSAQPLLAERMRLLEVICDITETDARAKADQRAKAESYGGREAVGGEPYIIFTPPPGVSTQEAWAGMATIGTEETAR